MAFQRFLVLSASFGTMEDSKGKSMDYASLIVTGGKLSRIQRDDRTGVDASKMRCNIELARRLVQENALPCIGDVDFELDGPKAIQWHLMLFLKKVVNNLSYVYLNNCLIKHLMLLNYHLMLFLTQFRLVLRRFHRELHL